MMLAREQSGTSTVRRRPMLVHEPILQNFVLIWLDLDNNVSNDDYHNATMQLQHIVNATHTFNDVDDCIDFLTEIEDQKVLMIISGTVHQHLIRLIHDIPRLHSVYIFCHGTENDRKQTNEWSKSGAFRRKLFLSAIQSNKPHDSTIPIPAQSASYHLIM